MKKLFATGVFWLVVALVLTYLVLYMVSKDLMWYQYLFLMFFFPGLFILVSTTILVRPESVSGDEFVAIMKHVSTIIYNTVITLFRKRE